MDRLQTTREQARYIRTHYCDAWVAVDGRLLAREEWTRRREDGTIEHGSDLKNFGTNPTWREVQDWLGY